MPQNQPILTNNMIILGSPCTHFRCKLAIKTFSKDKLETFYFEPFWEQKRKEIYFKYFEVHL